MQFEVIGIRSSDGVRVKGVVTAPDHDTAIREAKRQGINPERAYPASFTPVDAPAPRARASRTDVGKILAGSGVCVFVGALAWGAVYLASKPGTANASAAPVPPRPTAVVSEEPNAHARTAAFTPAPAPTWVAGVRHALHPRLTAGDSVGQWIPDDGWRFVAPGDLRVRWTPGVRHRTYANITASDKENYWRADPGYRFIKTDDLKTQWAAGSSHPTAPNVVASSTEGKWAAAKGYRFVNDRSNDLTVKRAISPQKIQEGVGKCVAALAIHQLTIDRNGDSPAVSVLRQIAREARNEALRSALQDLFPDESTRTRQAVVRLISMCADGELTSSNWRSSGTREAIMDRIRQESPAAGDIAEIAEFITEVIVVFRSR